MTYNYPYYEELIESYGMKKAMDLYAYYIPTKTVNDRSLRMADLLMNRLERSGIFIKNIEKKDLKKDLLEIKRIYRAAWEKNWGFVPPTDEEFDVLADGLKLILNYDYIYKAEKDGQMIGFAAAIPDINEMTKGFKNGSLFPFNIFKLLMGKNKTRNVRIILLGVLEEYRNNGVAAVFFSRFIKTAKEKGIDGGEASWVLENNVEMTKAAENLNGEKYKTYRIYSKPI